MDCVLVHKSVRPIVPSQQQLTWVFKLIDSLKARLKPNLKMSKKGISGIVVIIALIAFAAATIMLWLSTFSRPDIFNQITRQGFTIESDTQKDDYILSINAINFLRSRTSKHETAAELMQDLYDAWTDNDEARYNELNAELDQAMEKYLETYEKRCVSLELTNSEGRFIWLNGLWVQNSINCKQSGVGDLASSTPVKVTIPTRNPEQPITFSQRTGKRTSY